MKFVLAGENGSADTVRDPRGFAVKMYTDEGTNSSERNLSHRLFFRYLGFSWK